MSKRCFLSVLTLCTGSVMLTACGPSTESPTTPGADSATASPADVATEAPATSPAETPASPPAEEKETTTAPPAETPKAPPAEESTTPPEAAPASPPVEASSNPLGDIKMVMAEGESYPTPVGVGAHDWSQWGGSTMRNNTPEAENIPQAWDVGGFDYKTGKWKEENAKNIKWVARLGSQTYGNPVVANGKIYVGTNNGGGWLDRYPVDVDLGCLLCFRESDGQFLWQHSSEKLSTGRVHDWPLQGICCAPLVEGDRLWFVTSRGEVACLDTEGFSDGENDGPFTDEANPTGNEADAVWYLDMMRELGTSQHNMCSCSVTSAGDLLFVNTSNGLDESHINLPAPNAPSFICLNKHTGDVIWTDNSPGTNILHGQWSSPAFAVLGGVPQVLFPGGDGWLYAFHGTESADGKPKLLWKFDCNPKESKWILGGRGTRNNLIATPMIHDGLVYIAVGQDPEHGEGVGHLWCIDPTKRGDVSPELAFKVDDPKHPIPPRRIQAVIAEEGEIARSNPNSAVVWHYTQDDLDGDGKFSFEESLHRSCGTVTIKDDILYLADFSGLLHCLNAKTGKLYWTYDMLASAWGSPLIVDGKVYIGDEDGDLAVFKLSSDPDAAEPIAEINMKNAVYTTPIVANGVLYISNKSHLFAIENKE